MKQMFQLIVIINLFLAGFGTTALSYSIQNFTNVLTSNEETEYWALIVAVGTYEACPEKDLPYMLDQVTYLYNQLLTTDLWKKDNIRILTEKNATKINIIRGFQWLDEMDDDNDICLILLSTHGGHGLDLPPFDEDDGCDEYLATYRSFKYNLPPNPFFYIWDDELNYFLNKLDSKVVGVIITSCYSGGFNESISKLFFRNKLRNGNIINNNFNHEKWREGILNEIQGQGRVIIMTCRENELSQTGDLDFIVMGLQGYGDTDNDGWSSVEESFYYAKPIIESFGHNHPVIRDDFPGDLIIVENELPPGKPKKIVGPSIGYTNTTYYFSTSAIDPENDDIQFKIRWGNDIIEFSDLFKSNETAILENKWEEEGTYNIWIETLDEHGAIGIKNWSDRHVVTLTDEHNVDVRQTHTEYNNYYWYNLSMYNIPYVWVAQSFKPTLSTLSKVELEFFVYEINDPYFVAIKEDLYGDDLTQVQVFLERSDDIRKTKWTCFDFPDIEVIPGKTYYMVMKCYGEFEDNNVIGVVGPYNPYPDGEIYYSYDEGLSWIPLSDLTNMEIENIDACFVTYGK